MKIVSGENSLGPRSLDPSGWPDRSQRGEKETLTRRFSLLPLPGPRGPDSSRPLLPPAQRTILPGDIQVVSPRTLLPSLRFPRTS